MRAKDRPYDSHLSAIRGGDNFDVPAFESAFESADPDELNQVKAVERGVDQLYKYMAELTAFGLELGQVRSRHEETNARRDLDRLAGAAWVQRGFEIGSE